MALKSAAKIEGKIEIIPEESPVGDSQSNGLAEGGVKIVQGLTRTLADALEGRYQRKIAKDFERAVKRRSVTCARHARS